MAALSDANAVVIEKYEYDVFGEVIIYDSNGSDLSVSSVASFLGTFVAKTKSVFTCAIGILS